MIEPSFRAHCKSTPCAIPLADFGLLKITGKNAKTFLQGQLTYDVLKQNEHEFSFAACCDHKGRMLANFYIFQQKDDFLLFMPQPMLQPTLEHLHKYAIFSQVELSIADNKLVGLIAPNKIEFMQFKSFTVNTYQNCQLLTLPGEVTRLIVIGSSDDMTHLLSSLNLTIEENKKNWWQWFDIENCMTFILPATSAKLTPQMISLEKWGGVSFTKGCYVGQEVIARTQHLGKLKRHLQRAEVASSLQPQPGDDLYDQNGEALGIILQSVLIQENYYGLLTVIQDRAHDNPLYLQDKKNSLIISL